jgi:hypothetical protein
MLRFATTAPSATTSVTNSVPKQQLFASHLTASWLTDEPRSTTTVAQTGEKFLCSVERWVVEMTTGPVSTPWPVVRVFDL